MMNQMGQFRSNIQKVSTVYLTMRDDAFSAGSVNQLGIDFYFIGYRSIDSGEVMDSVLFAALLFKIVDGTWEKIELLGRNLVVDKIAIVLQNFFLAGPVIPR